MNDDLDLQALIRACVTGNAMMRVILDANGVVDIHLVPDTEWRAPAPRRRQFPEHHRFNPLSTLQEI